jgi:hypothetical protein
MRFYLIVLTLLVFVAGSCSDGNRCYEPVDTLMITSFSVNGFKPINALTINGVDRNDVGDTLVNDNQSAVTKRYPLPLSFSGDSTGLAIKANGFRDTLYIRHAMTLILISENCGFAPNYVINGFSFTKGIDSVKISDAKVNPKSIEKKANDQNIRIYFNSAVH